MLAFCILLSRMRKDKTGQLGLYLKKEKKKKEKRKRTAGSQLQPSSFMMVEPNLGFSHVPMSTGIV